MLHNNPFFLFDGMYIVKLPFTVTVMGNAGYLAGKTMRMGEVFQIRKGVATFGMSSTIPSQFESMLISGKIERLPIIEDEL
jgi:hypothetical protein